jgi:hypothetical protein
MLDGFNFDCEFNRHNVHSQRAEIASGLAQLAEPSSAYLRAASKSGFGAGEGKPGMSAKPRRMRRKQQIPFRGV